MKDYQKIIDQYYGEGNSELKSLLLLHSRAVADKALRICDAHPEFGLDRDFIEVAAMLHDIGIIRCDAPKIHCHGTEPYIRHGILGAEMLSSLLTPHSSLLTPHSTLLTSHFTLHTSRICQRHTGAGITRAEIAAQWLPLPLPDDDSEPYMPETLEEKRFRNPRSGYGDRIVECCLILRALSELREPEGVPLVWLTPPSSALLTVLPNLASALVFLASITSMS